MDSERQSIYNFIVTQFSASLYASHRTKFNLPFPSYSAFKAYQMEVVKALSPEAVAFAMGMQSLIKLDILESKIPLRI